MDENTFGSAFFDSLRRSGIRRGEDRWFGGVASGYAARMGVDPLLVRVAFIVFTLAGWLSVITLGMMFFGGLAVLVYGVSWALLPEPDGRIHLQEAFAGRFDGALALATALTLLGLFTSGVFAPGLGRIIDGALIALLISTVIAAASLVVWVIARAVGRRAPVHTPAAPDAAPTPPAPTEVLPAPTEVLSAPAEQSLAADAPAPPVYRKAPSPPRERAPGPGARGVAAAFAVILLASAGVLGAWQWNALDLPMTYPPVVAAGAVVLGLGILVTALGLMGRRAGVINLLLVPAIAAGSIVGGLTFDYYTANALAWSETRRSVAQVSIHARSVADLQAIDADLAGEAPWLYLTLDLPAPTRPEQVDLHLPSGTGITLLVRSDLPLDLRVTGTDAQVSGQLAQGLLETTRAVGNRHEGLYSLAAGGSLRYAPLAHSTPLTLTIDAPSGVVDVVSWEDQ